MSRFTVVYDACVLYPAPLRDTLMRLALTGLFKAHWTDRIHEEWITAVLRKGKHRRSTLERARDLMDKHACDAKLEGHEPLIGGLTLPDPDDRHVLAAAIHCHANAIVTYNRKDFPEDDLRPYSIDVIHPDDFIFYQIDMAPAICCRAIHDQRMALKNPMIEVDSLLVMLQKLQLTQTVSRLRQYADLL